MRRRGFLKLLAGSAAAWPFAAHAQQPGKVPRIGVLIALAQSDPEARAWVAGFLQGLEKRGWSEDRNLHIDHRCCEIHHHHGDRRIGFGWMRIRPQ